MSTVTQAVTPCMAVHTCIVLLRCVEQVSGDAVFMRMKCQFSVLVIISTLVKSGM